MLIAILMTNTDESRFAQAHPKDGEKFSLLLHELRPQWQFEVFNVKDNDFPEKLNRFDGFLITGSPASVRDDEPWIARLETMIIELHQRKTPVYGTCFGHQIIATALGGEVDYNSDGWKLGTVETQLIVDNTHTIPVNLYAAHKEQVITAPKEAVITASTPGCPIAGFSVGDNIATTQYHPEMTPEFMAALINELEKDFEPEVIKSARASLIQTADRKIITEVIIQFFESAIRQAK